jgi:hypothetical protein
VFIKVATCADPQAMIIQSSVVGDIVEFLWHKLMVEPLTKLGLGQWLGGDRSEEDCVFDDPRPAVKHDLEKKCREDKARAKARGN